MRTSIFKCEVITPMLSRSMYQKTGSSWRFELRPQSVKGSMRFWFRALAPCVVDPDWYEGKHKKLEALHRLESMIFGSQESKSPFSITVSYGDNLDKPVEDLTNSPNKFFRNALFGTYGMKDRNGELTSMSFLSPGESITLRIRHSKTVSELQKALTDSLILLISNYSGFGAKTRDGFGSFTVVGVKDVSNESIGAQYATSKLLLESLLREVDPEGKSYKLSQREPGSLEPYDFPTLASSREMMVFANSKDWRTIIKNLTGQRSMNGDAVSIYSDLKLNRLRKYTEEDDNLNPLRAAFFDGIAPSKDFVMRTSIMGLPIIYQKFGRYPGTTGKGIATVSNDKSGSGRKASPVFFSIHKKNDLYSARILLMASKISPERDSLGRPVIFAKVGSKSHPILGNENFEELWSIMREVIR